MSVRSIPLFGPGGVPTRFLVRQWTQRDPLQPLRLLPMLAKDRTALPVFRAVWTKAFPTRQSLPPGPLADDVGRGTDAFWSVF
jgi:hypothetical protein